MQTLRFLGRSYAFAFAGLSLVACSDSGTSGTGAAGGASASSGQTSGSTSTSSGPGATTTTTGSNTTSSASSGTGGNMPNGLDCTAPSGTVGNLSLTLVTNQLSELVLAISAPDDPDRIYAVQKSGEIMIIDNGQLLPTPFLDISNLVSDGGEEGLLGLAFHPDYANNGRFFVHYSKAGNGDNVVQEFKRSTNDPLVADPTPVAIVLEHGTAEPNHNGGSVAFGPDGFLYLSMGDGGNQGDPECDAQKTTGGEVPNEPENLLGKISRLDVDAPITATGYPAAAGNPSGHKAYDIGFRNPWRISFDGCTGDLYVGDVGQSTYEEVSVFPAAMGPINAGWPYREGAHDYNTPGTCPPAPANPVEPILDYSHGGGRCAVMGGYVYRSAASPALRDTYFYGDYCSGDIYMKQPGQPEQITTLNVAALSAFGQDGHGNVYACSLNGSLFRIDAQ